MHIQTPLKYTCTFVDTIIDIQSETKGLVLFFGTKHGHLHYRFTQKYILRVFPKGTRVTSTNFRPLTAWMHGAQMVAFNMQVSCVEEVVGILSIFCLLISIALYFFVIRGMEDHFG
jgi:hypothetical protein